jgi:NitT/TauT family transport system ATP-binding protein
MAATFPTTFEPHTQGRSARAHLPLLCDASKAFISGGVRRYIFQDLTLTMRRSERLVLMGPNACGKSTLLRILMGLQKVDQGWCALALEERDLRGAVLQDYRSQLLPWASVETNLLLPLGREHERGAARASVLNCAAELFDTLGYEISLKSKAAHLSGGQQQALVLARALAFEARFLIWDEPTSALDFLKRCTLYRTLQSYCAAHDASAIIVTHDFDEALILADRIIVFSENMQVLCDREIEHDGAMRDPAFFATAEAQSIRADIHAAIMRQRKPRAL